MNDRRYLRVCVAVLSIFVLYGCSSPSTKKINVKSVGNKNSTEIKKVSDGNYKIIESGIVKYKDLKYVDHMDTGGSLEILDKNNQKSVISYTPEIERLYNSCGNEGNDPTVYNYRATSHGDSILIYLDVLNNPGEKDQKGILLATIPESKADRVFFNNGRGTYVVSHRNVCNNGIDTIYFQKNNRYGVLGKLKYKWRASGTKYSMQVYSHVGIYDDLSILKDVCGRCYIKVKKNGLVGYLDITPIKYKTIGMFDETLARFTLHDDRKGYVSKDGKEYYDDEI